MKRSWISGVKTARRSPLSGKAGPDFTVSGERERSDMPLVSVVMSVYNGEAYLDEAIRSVLNQRYREFEFIIVNDGSTDCTAEILAEYQRQEHRILIHTQENRGHAASLNHACHRARGQYLAEMDADDRCFPDRLERQVEFLEQHPEVALVGGAVWVITREGRWLRAEVCPVEDAEIRQALSERCPFFHSTVMMRKAAFDGVGGYRPAFEDAEDLDLFLRLSERYSLANLPVPVGCYRVYAGQISQSSLKRQMMADVAARAAARMRRESGHDPFWDVERLTPAVLREHGIQEAEVEGRVVKALISRARKMLAIEGEAMALRLLDEALAYARSSTRRTQLSALVLRAYGRLCYGRGRILRGSLAYGQACCLEPALALALGRKAALGARRLALGSMLGRMARRFVPVPAERRAPSAESGSEAT
jgi:hypothetical protein